MASPQKENGYTPVANEILEQLIKLPLNGTQWRIVVLVWRYTYGFSRKEHELSESFIVKALGLNKGNLKQIKRELRALISLEIITVIRESSFNSTRVLAFNKNYDGWGLKRHQGSKKTPGVGLDTRGLKDTKTGVELDPTLNSDLEEENTLNLNKTKGFNGVGSKKTPGVGLDPQENNIKTNKTKEHFFESVWELYPCKKGKGRISDTQKAKLEKIGADELARCIERYKKDKPEWKHWQHGSTFFNSGYVDYLDKNYQQDGTGKGKAISHPEGFEVIR